MTIQDKFRMPATGEVWRHYKGALYTIVGISRDDDGNAVVVYTDHNWPRAELAPLYNQKIDRFLQELDLSIDRGDRFDHRRVARFEFQRDQSTENRCQYIDWAEVGRKPLTAEQAEELSRRAT